MSDSKSLSMDAPLGKLMAKFSIPCIISLLVGALYNIVDQIFIANASDLGSFGNAANTAVFPLTVIALGLAVMIGDGTCAFVSICRGSQNTEDAHRSVGLCVLLSVSVGVLLTALYLLFADPLLTLFGGRVNEETFRLAKEYFFYITLGIPFYVFGQAMNPVIRSDGSPAFAMFSTLAGAITNVILDPIFIYPLHMGMRGAAIATVIGQILTALLAAGYLCRMKTMRLEKRSFCPSLSLTKRTLSLGVPSFLAQASLVLSLAAIQSMCTKYAAVDPIFGQAEYAQIPLAVIGIVTKFFQIAASVAIGAAAGCIPVAGYAVGSGRKDRVRGLFTRLLILEAAVGAVALLVVEVFPSALIGIFGAAEESVYYTEFAVRAFRIYLCMLPLATVNKGTFIYMQALGKARESVLLSFTREVLFGVTLPLLLPLLFGLDGVLYSYPAADLLTALPAAYIIFRTYRSLSFENHA